MWMEKQWFLCGLISRVITLWLVTTKLISTSMHSRHESTTLSQAALIWQRRMPSNIESLVRVCASSTPEPLCQLKAQEWVHFCQLWLQEMQTTLLMPWEDSRFPALSGCQKNSDAFGCLKTQLTWISPSSMLEILRSSLLHLLVVNQERALVSQKLGLTWSTFLMKTMLTSCLCRDPTNLVRK